LEKNSISSQSDDEVKSLKQVISELKSKNSENVNSISELAEKNEKLKDELSNALRHQIESAAGREATQDLTIKKLGNVFLATKTFKHQKRTTFISKIYFYSEKKSFF